MAQDIATVLDAVVTDVSALTPVSDATKTFQFPGSSFRFVGKDGVPATRKHRCVIMYGDHEWAKAIAGAATRWYLRLTLDVTFDWRRDNFQTAEKKRQQDALQIMEMFKNKKTGSAGGVDGWTVSVSGVDRDPNYFTTVINAVAFAKFTAVVTP